MQRLFKRPIVTVAPAKIPEPTLIWNGKPQTLSQVRSSFGQQLLHKLGNRFVDWDEYALAEAHQTGLTAFACITTRATIASQIPLKVETAQGDTLPQSPAADFMARSREMLWWMTASWLVFGKVYLQKQKNQYGFASLLEYVNPIDVYPHINYAERRIENYRIAHITQPISPRQMIDIRNPSFTDDFGAVAPLELTMRRIAAQEAMAQWIASFFANGAKIDGILSYEGETTPEEIELQERRWKELFKGAMNAFKTFIAASSSGGSWKWQAIQNSFDELVMPETLKALREDICAALQTHPTLIGLGSASDALSAQSTYKAVHDEHVQYVALPDVSRFCEAMTEQWLATDFPIYGRLRIVPDLAAIQSDLFATSERATTVNTNLMSGVWTVNEGRKFLGTPALEGIVDRNPQWALQAYEAGGITFMEFRQALGYPKNPETFAITTDGFIYDLDPRYQGGLGAGWESIGPGGQLPPDPQFGTLPIDRDAIPTLPPPKPAIAGNPASISLSLANNGDLINLQNRLRQTFADPGIRWLEPEEFHITLIACPVIDDAALMALYEDIASKPLPTLALKVGSLASFDSVGEHAIHFRIRRNQDLIDLQARIAKWCQKNQIEISGYHVPELFQPHVTMCYAATKTRVIKFEGGLTVSPRELCIARRKGLEDWEDVYTLPMTAAARTSPHDPALIDLSRWQDKVKNKGVKARFHSDHIPAKVGLWIEKSLGEGWPIADVFTRAKDWIREGEDEPEPLGAPPDEWAEYWSGFDDIPDNMAELWLTYMEAISKPTLSRALDTTPGEFDLPDLQAERDKLIEAWVGTEDAPGPLLQFMLAGLAAGDRSLQRVTRANVSWDIALTDALAFAREYGYGLIRNIDETTRESIRTIQAKSIEEGWSKAQLEAELAKVLVIGGETPAAQIQRRAELIAQTEGIRAFNEGAFKRWDMAGVTRARWQTVNDPNVCPTCRALHGKVAEFRNGWEIGGKVYREIAHPGCRCFRRPVV